MTRLDLGLQFRCGGLFGFLHYRRIFFGEKSVQFCKGIAVAVMTGYHAVLFQRNDVADGHTRKQIVRGMANVEFLKQRIQLCPSRERSGIGQLVKLPVHALTGKRLVTEIQRFIAIPELVDSKAVPGMVEKSGLAFLLTVHPSRHSVPEVPACFPFFAENGEYGPLRLLHEIVAVKDHCGVFAGLNGIDAHILFQQFRRPFFGQGQEIPVRTAQSGQSIRRHGAVRHGVLIQHRVRLFRHDWRHKIRLAHIPQGDRSSLQPCHNALALVQRSAENHLAGDELAVLLLIGLNDAVLYGSFRAYHRLNFAD